MRLKGGQSTLEYTVLIVIVLAALLATTLYIKRGIQGRWKDAADNLGEQYDPTVARTFIYSALNTSAFTNVYLQNVEIPVYNTLTDEFINTVNALGTYRYDSVNTIETKTGQSTIDSY